MQPSKMTSESFISKAYFVNTIWYTPIYLILIFLLLILTWIPTTLKTTLVTGLIVIHILQFLFAYIRYRTEKIQA